MTKVPFQLRFEVIPDDSGLRFGKAFAQFHYYLDEDHNAVVTDRVCLSIEGDSLKLMDNLYDTILKSAMDKHECISREEALAKEFSPSIGDMPTNAVSAVVEAPERPAVVLMQAQALPPEPNMWGKISDFILGK